MILKGMQFPHAVRNSLVNGSSQFNYISNLLQSRNNIFQNDWKIANDSFVAAADSAYPTVLPISLIKP